MSADLEALEADYERLWLAYNHLQQNLPQCEHVREWQQQIDASRKAYKAALAAVDRAAANGAWPAPASSSLPLLEPEPADDGALFPREAA